MSERQVLQFSSKHTHADRKLVNGVILHLYSGLLEIFGLAPGSGQQSPASSARLPRPCGAPSAGAPPRPGMGAPWPRVAGGVWGRAAHSPADLGPGLPLEHVEHADGQVAEREHQQHHHEHARRLPARAHLLELGGGGAGTAGSGRLQRAPARGGAGDLRREGRRSGRAGAIVPSAQCPKLSGVEKS